jgi:hypothetical protein
VQSARHAQTTVSERAYEPMVWGLAYDFEQIGR